MSEIDMREPPVYTIYHPRWLRSHESTYWWLSKRSYLAFILREISSVFVAWSLVYLLLLVRAVSAGPTAYADFVAWSRGPILLLLNVVSVGFLVFHAITWFNLAPQAMVLHVGRQRVPGVLIAASNYAAWVVASALIAWLVLRAT
jgi:succinate dehydrogenase subunit C